MALIRNFAMTPEEMASVRPLPPGAAWMSCHFGPQGLSDLPEHLPEGALLILDDRIPGDAIEPSKILSQLTEVIGRFHCQALLLDLERPGNKKIPELLTLLKNALPCPVGVSALYGAPYEGPIFLPLLPPHRFLKDWIGPFQGKELWLEVSPSPERASVTTAGTRFSVPGKPLPPCPHRHPELFCHYAIEPKEEEILFTLYRTPEDLKALTLAAESLGVTRTIGLYQELF